MKHCLPSSILETELNGKQIDKINEYFENLTVTEAEMITLSRVHAATEIPYPKLAKVLLKCVDAGILALKYAVKCPNCGRMIKEFSEPDVDKAYKLKICYMCNSEVKVKDGDIVAVFSIVYNAPFANGQNQSPVDMKGGFDAALPYDTYSYLKEIAGQLKRSNDIEQCKIDNENKKEEQKDRYEKRAYGISKRNMKIRIALNISITILLGLIIYQIINTGENAKLSATISGITYMVTFVISNVCGYFFPVDIDKIVTKLKNSN